MTETLLPILLLVPALVIAIVFHEVAHGWAALALGDPTAREQRRLSFNPVRHVDPVGTLLVPGGLALAGLPVLGWARPVPVNGARLRNPRFGMMAVAAAGPAMNVLLALVGAVVLGLVAGPLIGSGTVPADGGFMANVLTALGTFIAINLFLAIFNLLPIPPFDGSHIVEGALPRPAARIYRRLRPYGFPLILMLLVVLPWLFPQWRIIEAVVLPPVLWAQGHYLALAQWVAGA